jgi:tetratricopeptide (TPR) repeat protein
MSLLNDALRKRDREYRQGKETRSFGKKLQAWRTKKTRTYGAISTAFFICLLLILGCWHAVFNREGSGNDSRYLATNTVEAETKANKEIPAPTTGNVHRPETIKKVAITQARTKNQGKRKYEYARLTASINDKSYPNKDKEVPGQKHYPRITEKNRVKQRETAEAEDVFYQKAISYHRHNMLKEAINMYQEVLRKNPKHLGALFNIASAYITNSAFSEAYPYLQELNSLDPGNFQVLLNLAVAEIGLDRSHEALSHLEMAEKLKTESRFEIFFHRAIALSRLERTEDSLEWYIKAEKLHPNHPLLLFNMAVLYDKSGQYKKALNYYETLMKQDSFTTPHEKEAIEARVRKIKAYLAWRYGQTEAESRVK